jgi:hypothetical protein
MTHINAIGPHGTKVSATSRHRARLDRSHRADALLDGVMAAYIRDIAGRPGFATRRRFVPESSSTDQYPDASAVAQTR